MSSLRGTCDDCRADFPRRLLAYHERTATTELVFLCPRCAVTEASSGSLAYDGDTLGDQLAELLGAKPSELSGEAAKARDLLGRPARLRELFRALGVRRAS